MKRLNFKDKQKAELFAREKGICAFCGTDLWSLRFGLCVYSAADWADHIKPAARGGGNSIENGICVCHRCNQKKGDNTRDSVYLYREGKPTESYWLRFDKLNPVVQEALALNAQLHWTDWYFNRAIIWLETSISGRWYEDLGFEPYKRDATYWAGAALKRVIEWRRYAKSAGIAHPRERGLASLNPNQEETLVLRLFDCESVGEVMEVGEALVPHYIGGKIFFNLKSFAFGSPEQGRSVIEMFTGESLDAALAQFLALPSVRANLIENEDIGILNHFALGGDIVLPKGRVDALLQDLSRHHQLTQVVLR